ncbi:MAG: autotransporter translocation and assembly factor TamB [Gammaproteobacteria bacterium]
MRARLLFLIFILLGIPVGLLCWLTMTESGLRQGLHWAALGYGQDLQILSSRGALFEKPRISKLTYRQGNNVFSATDIELDWNPSSLWQSVVDINRLKIRALDVAIETSVTSVVVADNFETDSHLSLNLPFEVILGQLDIGKINIKKNENNVDIDSVSASMALKSEFLQIDEISINGKNFSAHLAGNWDASNNWAHNFQLEWQARLPSGHNVDGSGNLKGQADSSKLTLNSQEFINFNLALNVRNLLNQPDWQLALDIKPVDLADTDFGIPAVIASAQLKATGDSKNIYVEGLFQAGSDSLGGFKGNFKISSTATENGFQQANLTSLTMSSDSGQLQATGMIDWQSELRWNTDTQISNLMIEAFLPDWPGSISARVQSDGHYVGTQYQAAAHVTDLRGNIKGYPVEGDAKLKSDNGKLSVSDLQLVSGSNKVTLNGGLGELLALSWTMNSEQLSQIFPQAEGSLTANGVIKGRPELPIFQARFNSDSLLFSKQDLGALTGKLELVTAGDSSIESLTGVLDFESSLMGHLDASYKLNKREVLAQFNGLEIEHVSIRSQLGKLSGNGLVDWYPELIWKTDVEVTDANPGYFWPQWGSNISGHLMINGSRINEQLFADIELSDFSGQVKDYPLNLSSRLTWKNNALEIIELKARSNQTSLIGSGRMGQKVDLNWELETTDLSDWLDLAQGQLKARGSVKGSYDVPILESIFSAKLLNYHSWNADSADGSLYLKWSDSPDLRLTLNIPQFEFEGRRFTDLKIDSDSKIVDAHVKADFLNFDVKLQGEFDKMGWKGLVTQANIKSQEYGDWHLKYPAKLTLQEHQLEISRACLIEARSEVCIKGHSLDGKLKTDFQATDVSTKMFQSWIGETVMIEGLANARGEFEQQKEGQLFGDLQVDITPATIVVGVAGKGLKEIAVQSAQLSLQTGLTEIETNSRIVLVNGDFLEAGINLPGGDLLNLNIKNQTIEGKINLSLKELGLFDSWVTEVENVSGILIAELDVFGTIENPRLKGALNIADAAFFHPGAEIYLDGIDFKIKADAKNRFNYRGSALTSGGQISASGSGSVDNDGFVKTNLEFNGASLDIARLLEPWAPDQMTLKGLIDFHSSLVFRSPDNLTGTAKLKGQDGFFEFPLANGESERWQYRNAGLELQLSERDINAQAQMLIGDKSQVSGHFKLPMAKLLALDFSRQTVSAGVELNFGELGFVEAVIPDIDQISGSVLFKLGVTGTLKDPTYDISSKISDANLVIPRLGLSLKNIRHTGFTSEKNRFDFNLVAESGDGAFKIKGHSLLEAQNSWQTFLNISGSDFELSNIPEAYILASPNLNISLKHHSIEIKGDLLIPYARLQPKDFSTAAQVSSDTVIIDSSHKVESGWEINSEVNLILGDRVKFFGFGFEGNLGGALFIEEKAGQPTRGNGEITVSSGRYLAYGQQLNVEAGRLLFTGGPITNPGIDVRATRRTGQIIAGVHALGRLSSPRLELFSIPAMGQTDMLSYLLLGRPMESASGQDNNMVAQAALALSISGGDKIARSIGQQLGFDEMRLEGSESGDQASLVVGRYLSPQLYISYGVGLVGSFNTFALRYSISEQWQLKAESGKVQGADILYTFER